MALLAPLQIVETLTTTATPEQVWAALQAAPRWPEVLSNLGQAWIDPIGELVEDAVIRTKAAPGQPYVDMDYYVLLAEPPTRLVFASRANKFRAIVDYRLRPLDDDRTELAVSAEILSETMLGRLGLATRRKAHTKGAAFSMRRRAQAMLDLAEDMASGKPAAAASIHETPGSDMEEPAAETGGARAAD